MNSSRQEIEQIIRELLAILPLLNRLVAAEVRREVGEDITMPQFRVLGHLSAGPLTLSALAKQRRVSLQSMSEMVQTLVERGWLTRTPDPRDRRQHLLQLTEHGKQHYAHANDLMLQRLVPLLTELTVAEREAVHHAMTALHRVLVREESEEPDGHNA